MSRHTVLTPDTDSVDFHKSVFDGRLWFKNPKAQWVAILLPSFIAAAASGEAATFSSWRRLPMIQPDHFSIPTDGNFSVTVYAPLGGGFSADLWGSLVWFDARKPPVPDASPETGIFNATVLRRKLEEALRAERLDKLRSLEGREHFEIWSRPDWRILELAPNSYSLPGWRASIDPNEPGAAEKMNAWRQPLPAGEYERIKRREKALRDEKAAAVRQAIVAAAEGHEDAPGGPEPAASATVEASAIPASQEPDTEPVNASPPLTLEQLREGRKTRAKLSKATKGKQRADKFNAAAAEAHARKAVKRMEQAGRL